MRIFAKCPHCVMEESLIVGISIGLSIVIKLPILDSSIFFKGH